MGFTDLVKTYRSLPPTEITTEQVKGETATFLRRESVSAFPGKLQGYSCPISAARLLGIGAAEETLASERILQSLPH